ncbi:MAG: methionyl-tRNA formyltransferase [Thermodesulfobacteriota bacterium]|nr:methionyl-tRNA formyltransferase [Thermodesulfobacteriota bacterium]
MRLIFIGSTKIGFECLKVVSALAECEVVGILTNPASFHISYSNHRVTNIQHTDFGPFAAASEIPVHVMKGKMTHPDITTLVRGWRPDFILVVGWFHMIPRSIRDIAPTGGLHASLLPDYSGGAPLVWAMINGENKTGITFFLFDDAVDSGPIIGQSEVPIYKKDTIATLYSRIEMAALGLLQEHLPKIASGQAVFKTQDESKRRIFPQRNPEDGEIIWEWSAKRIYDFIRAQTKPYPGAFTFWKKKRFTIWCADIYPIPSKSRSLVPGEITGIVDQLDCAGLSVASGQGNDAMLIKEVEEKGHKQESGVEFARRNKIVAAQGEILGR